MSLGPARQVPERRRNELWTANQRLTKKEGLTQEQFALKLNVTRQAVSNWENDKNLPDLELLILMSSVFSISLDQLILGGTDMNNMTEKLVKDGREGAVPRCT